MATTFFPTRSGPSPSPAKHPVTCSSTGFCRHLGMHMMTAAVVFLAERDFPFLYLGSCYSGNALYKTQFSGAEFFNGFRWSANLEELKYLIGREHREQHLLETEEYRQMFYE